MSDYPDFHLGYSDEDEDKEFTDLLVGRRVVSADLATGRLGLDDGTVLAFSLSEHDCCSWADLKALSTSDNVITSASIEMDWPCRINGESEPVRARIVGVTESGIVDLAESLVDSSNGYYLNGFGLSVEVIRD